MPTVYRIGRFRLHFYSNEGREPPHVHVRRGDDTCKFWLPPTRLAYNRGMKTRELTRLEHFIRAHKDQILEKWYEYFS